MRLNRPTNILANGRFFPPAATTRTTAAAAATSETHATGDVVDASYVGKRVRLNSGHEGTLRFVGVTDFGRGVWCGVELDTDDGTTDGMANDVRYFSCAPSRGVFVLVSKVRPAKKRPNDAVREYLSGVSDSGSHSLLGIGASGDVDRTTGIDRCSAAGSPRYPWRGAATVDPDAMPTPDSCDRDESLGILTPDEMGELMAHSNDVTLLADDGEPRLSPLNIDAELTDPLQGLLSREQLPVDQPSGPATITLSTASKCDETFTITAAAPAAIAASFVTSATSIGSWDNGYQSDGECSRPTSRGAVIATTRPSPDPPTDSDFYTESDYEETKTSKCCAQGDRKARIIDGKLFGSPPPSVAKFTPAGRSRNSPASTKGTISIDRERSEVSEEMDSSVTYSDADSRVEEKTKSRPKKATDENNCSEAIAACRGYARVDDDDDDDDNAFSRETVNNGVETAKVETRTPSASGKTQNAENALKRPAKCKEFGSVKSTAATKAKIARQNVTAYKAKMGTISTSSSNGCCEDENQENHRPTPSSSTRAAAKKTTGVGRWDTVLVKVEKEGREDGKTKATRSKEAISKKGRDETAKAAPSKLHKDVKVFSPNANAMNKAAAATTTTTTGKRPTAALPDTTKSSKFSKNSASSYRIAKSRKTRTRPEADPPMRSTKNSESSVTSSQKSSIIDISDSRVDSSQRTTRAGARIATKYVKDTKCSSLLSTPTGDTAVPIIPLHSDLMATKATKMSPLSLPRTKSAVSKQIGSVNSLNGDVSTNTTSALHTVPRRTAHRPAQPIVSTRASNRAPTTNGRVKNNPLRSAHDEYGRRTRRVDTNCKAADDETTQLSRISTINPLLARLKYATDGMEAFIILFQKLTSDTDVFALDRIKRELSKSKEDCWDMKMKLEAANVGYGRLQDEIETARSTHERKLKELRDIHTAQLNRLNENQKQELEERLSIHKMELEKLKNEFKNKEDALRAKYDENLRTLRKQAEQKLDDILQETKLQVERLKMENEAWRDKLLAESREKLQTADAKYKDEIRTLETNYTNLLDRVAQQARKRRETAAKSATKSTTSCEGELDGGEVSDVKIEGRPFGAQNVEDEICSLRTVLELKHDEIQELRKQNEKFKKAAQDLPFVEQKLDSVQARVEDLSAQLEAKVEIEKQLLKENRRLLDAVHYENEKKKRLAFQNEELWWKLKNSARVAKTLAVYNNSGSKDEGRAFAHSTPLHQKGPSLKSLKRSRTEHDFKRIDMSDNDEEIEDISSKVLAVVEKNDSVSWVLEIDESPVAVASRMLKRANSLTGISSKRRNKTQHKLHHSMSVPAGNRNDSRAATTVESTYNGE